MARFTGKKAKETPALNMGSMSDIIFMLLFFFMTIKVPKATETIKLQKKSLVSYINVGTPMAGEWQKKYGTESRIQLNDQISEVSSIPLFVESEISARAEADRPFVTFSIKADKNTKMGLISDIKQELRNSGAFKIFYNAAHGERK